MTKKNDVMKDANGREFPIPKYKVGTPEPETSKTAMKYMFLGLFIALLIVLVYVKGREYTLMIYKPEPKPQFLDIEVNADADVNSLVLMNVDDVHNICGANVFGCRVNYVVGKKSMAIENG